MNKSSTEIVKTPKQIMIEKLLACEKQCDPNTLRAAKSAFVVYFRKKYIKSLQKWKEAYANRGVLMNRSVLNPEDRGTEDKKLERLFNDGKFLENIDPTKEFNEVVINECFESIEKLLGDENNIKSDHRFKMLEPALKHREMLLGYVFTDLEAQIQASGAKVKEAQNPQHTLIDSQVLKASLEELLKITDAAYEMGVKAGRLKKGDEEKKKYRNTKIAPFIRKDLIPEELPTQYAEYAGKTKERFVAFQAEYVQRAMSKRKGDEVPPAATFPTACDLELEAPKGSLQDFINAKCLKEALFALDLNDLPSIKGFYQGVKVLEEHCTSLYEGLVKDLKTLEAPSYPEYYFKYKAIKRCVDELCQRVDSDPSKILKQCMPAKFNVVVAELSQTIIEKIDTKLNSYWSTIVSKTNSWELAPDRIAASVDVCKQAARQLSQLRTSEMLDEEKIRNSQEHYQAECSKRVDAVAQERSRALVKLAAKLEGLVTWVTVNSMAPFSEIEDEIVYKEADKFTARRNGTISEEECKVKLNELAVLLNINLSIDYKNQIDVLKKRLDQLKEQAKNIRQMRIDVYKIISEIESCKDDEISQKCFGFFTWMAQCTPQSITEKFEKKIADIFWVQVYLNIGFEGFLSAVTKRIESPFKEMERSILWLSFEKVEQVWDRLVVRMPRALTKENLEKTIASCIEQLEKLTGMNIGNVLEIFNQAKKCLPSAEVKAVLVEATGKAADEEIKAKLNRVDEMIADRAKATSDMIVNLMNGRINNLNRNQDTMKTLLDRDKLFKDANFTCLKREIENTNKYVEEEAVLLQKIQELVQTLRCDQVVSVSEKLSEYQAALEQYKALRNMPKTVADMKARLLELEKLIPKCQITEFSALSQRVAAERAIVDKDKNIPLSFIRLEACEKLLLDKKKVFEEELMAQIKRLTKDIFGQLELEIKKGTGDFEKIKQWLVELEGIGVTAAEQGLTLSTDEMKAYVEHAQKKIIEILNAHNIKTLSVLDVDAGSLSSKAYQANRKYFENEWTFAENMQFICGKLHLAKAYAQYRENFDRALVDFNDQEQECLFFETLKTLEAFGNLTLETMNPSELAQYLSKFKATNSDGSESAVSLLGILDARLKYQSQSANPRNLNDCFRAFENAIPNPPESDSATAELKAIPPFLEELLEARRKLQMANFKTKIAAAVQAKDFALAEKLLDRLDPKGDEMSESWGYYVYSVFERLGTDRSLTHEDRQTQNVECLRATLIKMASCEAKQRIDFCNFILTPLTQQMQVSRYSVDLEALVLLLRITEHSRTLSGWLFWPEGIKEIVEYLPDSLGIMQVMGQFLKGQTVDGEQSSDNWCRSRLLYVNSIVKQQLQKGTEKRSVKTVAFLNETQAAYEEYCRKDQEVPRQDKTPAGAKRAGLLARRKAAIVAEGVPQETPVVAAESQRSYISDRNVGLGTFFAGVRSDVAGEPAPVFGGDQVPGQEEGGVSDVAGYINSQYGNRGNGLTRGEEVVQASPVLFEVGANFFSKVFGPEARGALTTPQVQAPATPAGELFARFYGQNGSTAVQAKSPQYDDESASNGFGFNGFTGTNE